MPSILAFVLAGGEGSRLYPLTATHCKPAVPFVPGYRIIDFVLSNLVNSRIAPIVVLAQAKPESLIEHIRTAWATRLREEDPDISVVLPRSNGEMGGFKGTADAVYQNLSLIERYRPDLVAVFAADHIYRMDLRQMVDFHLAHKADVSIAARPVPVKDASSFGVLVTGRAGQVLAFEEKSECPTPLPTDPSRAYASMGNYLFTPQALVEALQAADLRGETDFGRHILPRLTATHRVFAYDFMSNRVPGLNLFEERGYWRDVGTVEWYRAAQRDVLGPLPRLRLANPEWPIRSDGYCGPIVTSGRSTGILSVKRVLTSGRSPT